MSKKKSCFPFRTLPAAADVKKPGPRAHPVLHGRRLRARRRFPRGLLQPPGSYRFSLEALLLACWLPLCPGLLGLDLGAGCGVVGLGLLCRQGRMRVHGLEVQPFLARAALHNARRMGFGRRFAVFCGDAADPDLFAAPDAGRAGAQGAEKPALLAGAYDLVLTNPPYRRRDAGRLPRSPARQTALFAHDHTLDAFCGAAARALKPGGRLGIIYPYARKKELLAALDRAGLRPVRLLPLSPRAGKPASLLLLEAHAVPVTAGEGAAPSGRSGHGAEAPGRRKGGESAAHAGGQEHNGCGARAGVDEAAKVDEADEDTPLALHAGTGFSAAAVAFCPFLRPAGDGPEDSESVRP